MATLIKCIDDVTSWLNGKLESIKLKEPIDEKGNYKESNPKAFAMFLPLQNNSTVPAPSVTVQIYDSIDQLKEQSGTVTIVLHTAIWNPGTHAKEKNMQQKEMPYERNSEGWKDAVTLCDFLIDEIKKAGNINGHRVLYENGIKCYPYKEQNAIIDFYPYYYMDIEFTVAKSFATTPKPYDDFL